MPPPAVRTQELKSASEAPLQVRGTIQADSRLRLGFKQPGVITAVLVKVGDQVRQGQALARLDQTDALSGLRVAGANLKKSMQDFKRAERLVKEGAVPTSARDDARASLEVAQANLSVASENYKRTQLLSPVGGKVVQRVAGPGESVGPGSPVLIIDETDHLVVRVGVTDRDLQRLEVGQATSLQPEDGSPAFKGVVSSLASTPNTTDGLYAVEIQPEKLKLQAGTLIAVRFQDAKPDEILRIPLEAIVRRLDQDCVFIVEGDKNKAVAYQRKIELGRSEGKEVAVRAGLKHGERIITEGAYFLQDKQTVQLLD